MERTARPTEPGTTQQQEHCHETFETLREAQEWRRIMEGKVTGEEPVDLKRARATTLRAPAIGCSTASASGLIRMPRTSRPSSAIGRESKLADWSLASIHDWDLIEWRREVLDEDGAEDGEAGRRPSASQPPSTGSMRCRS